MVHVVYSDPGALDLGASAPINDGAFHDLLPFVSGRSALGFYQFTSYYVPGKASWELRRMDVPLVVQKFGGSSVATAERIMAAARRAIQARKAGKQVIVVVDARDDTT